ncbi:phosphomethylpyrimidine kinase [Bifidobacterium longum]|uniref:Phosphomethylpyrimidine kinase n=1 Tax=Bifidobacterium longum TaxID=216816 RepID=A0A396FT64_BIFLN|nr:phosphomethylpyrimidine kinase [Bifidobacterium longum]RGL66177.1 phosphomethylpyrimidine kinase [Bifidobacterium longum]RGR18781.1 phosphomethylpyrimidine kinase [Bifidobacterium longum]RHM27862.1 phosphomethylpyrimidine kinase [Bifidobacterium longum]
MVCPLGITPKYAVSSGDAHQDAVTAQYIVISYASSRTFHESIAISKPSPSHHRSGKTSRKTAPKNIMGPT